jgi:hypothetical protein
VIARGLRTLALVLVGLCAFTAIGSLLIGISAGLPAQRALSGGFMLVGALLFSAGAIAGLRDPGRQRQRDHALRRARSGAAPATWTDAFHLSVVLVGLGMCLVLLGVLLNPRTSL